MHFTKLFNSILDSTIWQESKEAKLVWITMLAMCDKNGEVHASIPGLAVRSGVSLSECEEALICLSSPDKYSRTKTEEGRRIADIEGGWVLLNHGKYRALLSQEERREYLTLKQREHRAKLRVDQSTSVNKSEHCEPPSTQAEAEAEAEEQITIKEKWDSAKSPFLQNPEFAGVAAAFRKARTAKHGAVSEEVVEAWYYSLGRYSIDEAIAILRFSTACEAKKPITNGDHKAKPPPERNGKPKTKTDEVNDIIKRTFANGK